MIQADTAVRDAVHRNSVSVADVFWPSTRFEPWSRHKFYLQFLAFLSASLRSEPTLHDHCISAVQTWVANSPEPVISDSQV
jgi:hypothetical protein